ncbi:MAG: LCP family protein [Anaerolineae bacterium]|nr:LCP family protein [Anaerolineae bacterium]
MSTELQQRKRISLRGILSFFTFRIIPTLLLMAILWTLFQIIGVLWSSYIEQSQIASRQGDYAATASAIAAQSDDNEQGSNGQIRLMQFATNTPQDAVEEATVSNGGGGFPTNTPIATEPPSITATPILPTDIAERQQTPIVLPTFFPPANSSEQTIAGTAVPTRVPVIPRDYELINILLLGDDGEITNDNTLRTDTMIIVSINTETESVAMMSLPRDLFIYTPTPTMTRLNTVFGIGESFGWSGGGFGLMRETIFYNFGIQLHYYAKVNLSGMREIIDTLGGVDIAVDCNYQDYALIGADVPSQAVLADEEALLYTLPVGYYHFTGGEALWFARTRNLTTDFDRGRRQQQLLRAIYRAGRDNGQLANLLNLWGQLTSVVETDIPLDVAAGLLPIALNLDAGRIENFTLIRTYHTLPWQPPSGPFAGQFVQLPIYEPVRQLFEDFYQPPTSSQLQASAPTVAVYNGTSNENWDIVASERLRASGLNAYAAGVADQTNRADTQIIDYAGLDRGSPLPLILEELNISNANVTVQPDPQRTVDYEVIVGSNYDSCAGNVLEAEG